MRPALGFVLYFLVLGAVNISSVPLSDHKTAPSLPSSPDKKNQVDAINILDYPEDGDFGAVFYNPENGETSYNDVIDYNEKEYAGNLDGDDEVEGPSDEKVDKEMLAILGPVDFFDEDAEVEDADDNEVDDNEIDLSDSKANEFDPVPLPPPRPFRLPGEFVDPVSSVNLKAAKKPSTIIKKTMQSPKTAVKPKPVAPKKAVKG